MRSKSATKRPSDGPSRRMWRRFTTTTKTTSSRLENSMRATNVINTIIVKYSRGAHYGVGTGNILESDHRPRYPPELRVPARDHLQHDGVCYQDAAAPGADARREYRWMQGRFPVLQNLVGSTLPASPRNKVALNPIYTFHFTPGSLALSGTYIWRDQTYDSVFNRSYNLDPSYARLTCGAIWSDSSNHYNVIIYGNNVFNKIAQDAQFGLGVTNPGPGQVIDPWLATSRPGSTAWSCVPLPLISTRAADVATPPRDVTALLNGAAASYAQGRLNDAADLYRQAAAADPQDLRPLYSLALIDIRRGRLENARQQLRVVTALDPNFYPAQQNLGAVCQNLNLWQEAADAYRHALSLNPTAVETHFSLARALTVLGRVAESSACYHALAANPSVGCEP